ncbi:MAG: hypothetical protein Q4F18_12050, partial [Clostridia bacterium]|nr:hypothetical protein [Clostridia bacterium]
AEPPLFVPISASAIHACSSFPDIFLPLRGEKLSRSPAVLLRSRHFVIRFFLQHLQRRVFHDIIKK